MINDRKKTIDAPEQAAQAAKPARWGQARRLEFIDFRLRWEGRVNRADLIDFFRISVPQASLDFARYMELAPKNIEYDRSEKAYLATAEFSPVVATGEAQGYLNQLLGVSSQALEREASFLGWTPPLGAVNFPGRKIEASVLRKVLAAIRRKRMLRVEYQSMNRPNPSVRGISPHAVGFDGFRWHVRAYCHEHHDFRDFVFARILNVISDEESTVDPLDDAAWMNRLDVVLAPHPELLEGQRRAIELDYGMKDGRVSFQSREALLFYVLRRLGLDRPAQGTPQAQQIVLVNRDALQPFLERNR
jgi:predicted DNA-binding transcriptional regulator YafY